MACELKEMLADLQKELDIKYDSMTPTLLNKVHRVYIRGDVHGNFDWLKQFCEKENTTTSDVIILAGDSGLLFYGKNHSREKKMKEICAAAPITFLVVRGNHDNRPANENMQVRWNNLVSGDCYWEDEYPNILYATEIGRYFMCYKHFLTIGGAYSIDKFYRIAQHWTWYADEELTDQEMNTALQELAGDEFDYIVSHTAPLNFEPTWCFMKTVDQTSICKRMETFLQRIQNCVNYRCWFWGHYHDDHHWRRLDPTAPLTIDDPGHIMLMKDIGLLEQHNTYSYLSSAEWKTVEIEIN